MKQTNSTGIPTEPIFSQTTIDINLPIKLPRIGFSLNNLMNPFKKSETKRPIAEVP